MPVFRPESIPPVLAPASILKLTVPIPFPFQTISYQLPIYIVLPEVGKSISWKLMQGSGVGLTVDVGENVDVRVCEGDGEGD